MIQRVMVWDVPTRVFHWLLVASFAGAYLTAESERYRDIHVMLGYTLFGLLAFRVLWGFIGTRYAQFKSFLFKPGEVATYAVSLLKGKAMHYVGHNPAGSISIWLLLTLGMTLGVTGLLLMQDDVNDNVVNIHALATNIMLVVVAIHLAGVLVSSVLHRENLVRAMVTGIKFGEPGDGISRSFAWLGAIMLAAVGIFWFLFMR